MNIPFPYPPTSMGEGDRENYSSLKPELHHTFVWGDPPGACKGRDRLTQHVTQWCEGDPG